MPLLVQRVVFDGRCRGNGKGFPSRLEIGSCEEFFLKISFGIQCQARVLGIPKGRKKSAVGPSFALGIKPVVKLEDIVDRLKHPRRVSNKSVKQECLIKRCAMVSSKGVLQECHLVCQVRVSHKGFAGKCDK